MVYQLENRQSKMTAGTQLSIQRDSNMTLSKDRKLAKDGYNQDLTSQCLSTNTEGICLPLFLKRETDMCRDKKHPAVSFQIRLPRSRFHQRVLRRLIQRFQISLQKEMLFINSQDCALSLSIKDTSQWTMAI